jgi:hypothetical protein
MTCRVLATEREFRHLTEQTGHGLTWSRHSNPFPNKCWHSVSDRARYSPKMTT